MATDAFDQFWAAYPRKTAKLAARKALEITLRRASIQEILQRLEIVKRTEWVDKSANFIPHPSTWLRREEFETSQIDEPPPLVKVVDRHERAELLRAIMNDELQAWATARVTHQHNAKCRCDGVCKYDESRRPTIPSIDDIMEQMS
jgi:hypothetical protein